MSAGFKDPNKRENILVDRVNEGETREERR